MLQKFGPIFSLINRDRNERSRFLDLLERDLDSVIKCTACNKLHGALKTLIPPNSPLVRHYRCTGRPPSGDYSIPTRITPKIVASILKLHGRGRSYYALVREINTSRSYVRDDEVLLQIAHVSRVCGPGAGAGPGAGGGTTLILRTQQVWATVNLDVDAVEELTLSPSDMQSYVYDVAPRMLESLCLHHNWGTQCHAICNHHDRPSHSSGGYSYGHATVNGNGNGNASGSGSGNGSSSGSGSSGGSGNGGGSGSGNGNRNGNSHGNVNGNGNGNGNGNWNGNGNGNGTRLSRQTQYHLCPPFSMINTRNFDRLLPLTGLQGCSRCHTDFQVEITRLPRPFGAGFLFTTWKDLGRGVPAAHDPWASHDVLIATPPRDPAEFGDIRRRFDTAGGITADRPGITRHNLRQIEILGREVTERGEVDVALGQTPDATTGLFADFVPLNQNWFPAGDQWV